MIANLMLKPADILILDEPTNDLDIPSLQVLEQSLEEFPGAIVLVTHDRFLLSRLADEMLALDGEGGCKFFLSLEQWQQYTKDQAKEKQVQKKQAAKEKAKEVAAAAKNKTNGGKKLSYKLQHELDNMEKNIHQAEAELEELKGKMNDPKVANDHQNYGKVCDKYAKAQIKVSELYARWEELEELKAGG